MANREELLAALEWAFERVGRPTRRLRQNAEHYDRYFEVEALIERERKALSDV